jgi:N-acetylneuraminic acid mutarotase
VFLAKAAHHERRMTSLPVRQRRATTWIVFGVVAVLAIVAAVLAVSLLSNLQTGTGPTASASTRASATAGPTAFATAFATSSGTPHASPSASSPPEETPAGWTATGAMVAARGGNSATLLLNGKVLVAGGLTNSPFSFDRMLASAELYDPSTGSWILTGSMLEARSGHVATLLPDGRVLVVGGSSTGGMSDPLASAEVYDPTTATWSATGSMIEARVGPTATLLLDGTVLVAGGAFSNLSGDALASAELYNSAGGTWTATAAMIETRSGHTATPLADGKVLVAGDGSGILHASAELYDPSTKQWTTTASMGGVRSGHAATLLQSGKVVVMGGGDISGNPLASAEVFDPATGSWTGTGTLIEARYDLTATLLLDGTVLVAGGFGGSGSLVSAELYNPSGGSWTAVAGMTEARHGPTATRLPDGKVLVAGGVDISSSHFLASAELYDPGSGT